MRCVRLRRVHLLGQLDQERLYTGSSWELSTGAGCGWSCPATAAANASIQRMPLWHAACNARPGKRQPGSPGSA